MNVSRLSSFHRLALQHHPAEICDREPIGEKAKVHIDKAEELSSPLRKLAHTLVTDTYQAATGHAHSKLILIGEHAVVHGKPAIALPFPLVGVEAVAEAVPGPLAIACDFYQGPLDTAPEGLRGLAECILGTLRRLGALTEGLLIRLASTIPPGRGLGSSAAVAVAVVRSIFAYYHRVPSHSELISLANIAEVYAHGTPSGIDALAASANCPMWFIKGQEPEPLPTGAVFELVVADSGRVGDTRSAVDAVHERLAAKPEETRGRLHRLGSLAREARQALAAGDAEKLGQILNRAQAELTSLGVSDSGLNRLVRAACKAGALGAKLTGGGRGGCILALARDAYHAEQLCSALARAGARAIWRHTLGEVHEC